MREILFRGKRADTGDWVKGFYVQKPNIGNIHDNPELLEGGGANG